MWEKNTQKLFSYFYFSFFFGLMLGSPFILEFIQDLFNQNIHLTELKLGFKHTILLLGNSWLIALLILSPSLFFNLKIAYLIFILLLFYIPALLDICHVILFGQSINPSAFYTFFDSYFNESLSFVNNYSSWKLILFVLFFAALIFLSFYVYQLIKHEKFKRFCIVFNFCFLLIFLTFFCIKSDFRLLEKNSTFRFFSSYLQYQNDKKLIATYSQKIPQIQLINSSKNTHQKQIHLVVIGESLSKFHMGLYGYHRNTTPFLQNLKNELVYFDHVITPNVHTVEALKNILTVSDNQNNVNYDLVDYFKKSHFKTTWISNQALLGENQNWVSAIGSKTDQQIYINPQGDMVWDGNLIQELKKQINDTTLKQVIFIHLMGNHLSYQDRYPPEFNNFKSSGFSVFGDKAETYINHYDNSVKYNDFVLSEFIRLLKQQQNSETSLVYFSDHGDEVYDFRDFHGHHEGLKSNYMEQVPLLFWKSDKSQFQKGKNTLTQTYSLKNLIYSLQDFYSIKTIDYQKNKSVFYQKTNELNQQKITKKQAILFKDKIWVHRVNSIERLNEIQTHFKGMELDVVFENGVMDIRHPPAKSIGLSLKQFLNAVKNIHQHYFWLDLKNLNSKNIYQVITYLNDLNLKYNLKNKVIVESNEPELLKHLEKNGYLTSYYLPEAAYKNLQEAENIYSKAQQKYNKNPSSLVSQSVQHQQLMQQYFPHQKHLIWALENNWKNPNDQKRIQNYLNTNPNVQVVLVSFPSKGWR